MLTAWLCPLCYIYPAAVKPELTNVEKIVKSQCDRVLNEVKQNVPSPEVIKATVDEAVTTAFNKNSADTKKVITETMQQKNAQVISEVMKSSKERMDSDTAAREQRKCNVTVKNVPESTHRDYRERQAEDARFALKILNISEDQLVKVARAGPPIGSRPNDTRVSRVLIITVDSPELANYLHNYGRGWFRKTVGNGPDLWVNPDLIKADRDANWRARQLAKHRRQERLGHGEFRVLDELNGSRMSSSPGSQHSGRVSPPRHADRQQLGRRNHAGTRNRADSLSSVSSDNITVISQEQDARDGRQPILV